MNASNELVNCCGDVRLKRSSKASESSQGTAKVNYEQSSHLISVDFAKQDCLFMEEQAMMVKE